MNHAKGIITIAIGRKYIRQAKYLALSAILHAPHLTRAVVTDCPDALKDYYDVCVPYNPEWGSPFETKTAINFYSPFEQTLYLDADCLVMNNIDSYWEALKSRSFAYRGTVRTSGEWYADIEKMMARAGVSWIPQFNSGMFLFDKSEKATAIFEVAREWMKNQGSLGVPFFRANMLPDEPFFAMALAQHDEKPFEDHGRFCRAPIGASNIHLDVIKGVSYFRTVYGYYVYPLTVHFCGRFGRFLLFFQQRKLARCFRKNTIGTAVLRRLFSGREDARLY